MKRPSKPVLIVAAAIVASVLALGIALFSLHFLAQTTVQRAETADQTHRAKLIRFDGLDRWYHLELDGHRIYTSPEFSPRNDIPFREAIYFTADGKALVFEVGRRRIAGFDTQTKRALTNDELLRLPEPPPPALREYGFRGGGWPGEAE